MSLSRNSLITLRFLSSLPVQIVNSCPESTFSRPGTQCKGQNALRSSGTLTQLSPTKMTPKIAKNFHQTKLEPYFRAEFIFRYLALMS